MGFSARDRAHSFRYAGAGLWWLVASQHNARIHAVATVLAVGLGVALGISRVEWCAIVLAIGLVWVAEGLNTGLEQLADAAIPQRDERVGRAKDVAAAAVLVAAIVAGLVGALVFVPRVVAWLGS